jgi:hypothetical protein
MTKSSWRLFLLGVTVFFGIVHYFNAVLGWPSWLMRFFFDLGRENTLPAWFSSILWFLCSQACYDCSVLEKRNPERLYWRCLAAVFLFCSADEAASLHEHIGHSLFRWGTSDEIFLMFPHSGWNASQHSIWVIGLAPLLLAGCYFVYKFFAVCCKDSPAAAREVKAGFTILLLGAVVMEFLVARDGRATDMMMEWENIVEECLEMTGVIFLFLGLREQRGIVRSRTSRDVWE